jgi:hypothetical protein
LIPSKINFSILCRAALFFALPRSYAVCIPRSKAGRIFLIIPREVVLPLRRSWPVWTGANRYYVIWVVLPVKRILGTSP